MRILLLVLFLLSSAPSAAPAAGLVRSSQPAISSVNVAAASPILYDPRSQPSPNRAIYNVKPFPDQPSEVAQVTTSENIWKGADRLAIQGPGQWIQLSCKQPSALVGVHFWGDENDGFARVLVDGEEVWRGNTYGPVGAQFYYRLEMAGLPLARHILRVEALGQNGGPGGAGGSDVMIYDFSCTMEMPPRLFLPYVMR